MITTEEKDTNNALPVHHDNPWDFVPDQPKQLASPAINTNNCDSSSGISSTSGNSNVNVGPSSGGGGSGGGGQAFSSSDDWFQNGTAPKDEDPFEDKWALEKPVAEKDEFWAMNGSGILDDPFDAEWAALATRNNSKNTNNTDNTHNPFRSEQQTEKVEGNSEAVQTFELQM